MQRIDKIPKDRLPSSFALWAKGCCLITDSALLLIWGSVNADFPKDASTEQKQKQKQRPKIGLIKEKQTYFIFGSEHSEKIIG